MSLSFIQDEIEKLEPAERAALIDVLWDSLDEGRIRNAKQNGPQSQKIELTHSSAVS